MPAPSKIDIFQETQTQESLLNSALERLKANKRASSFSILRKNVVLKEHVSLTSKDCIGSNGTQTGTEVEFVIDDQHEKTLVCNHCYKLGLIEQK